MATIEDLNSWTPRYITTVFTRAAGHKVTPDEWNDNWNLAREQGDSNAEGIANLLSYLLGTVLSANGSGDYIYYGDEVTVNSIIATLIDTTNSSTSGLAQLAIDHATLVARVGVNEEDIIDLEARIDQAVLDLIASLEVGEVNLSLPIRNYIDTLLADLTLLGNENIGNYGFLTTDSAATAGYLKANDIIAFGYVDQAQVSRMIDGIDVYAPTIQSITNITEIMYAKEGRVARLTVDKLLTGDPLNGDETINYVDIDEQHIRWKTATRDDSLPLVQYTTRDDQLLYWLDSAHTTMTTLETDPSTEDPRDPVMVPQYDILTKSAYEFIYNPSSGYYEPRIVMGAGYGAADPDRGKAFIYKDADSIKMEYITVTGDKYRIDIGEHGIFTYPSIVSIASIQNTAEHVAADILNLEPVGYTGFATTLVKFDIQANVTASAAMNVLCELIVDGVVVRSTTKYYASAYTDSLVFHGTIPTLPSGPHAVECRLTASTGTIAVAAGTYEMVLLIRGGSAVEAKPYPVITVYETIPKVNVDRVSDMISVMHPTIGEPVGLSDTVTSNVPMAVTSDTATLILT